MPRTKKKITAQSKKPAPGRRANGTGSIRQRTKNGKVYWEGRYSVKDPLTGKNIQRSVSGKTQGEAYKKLIKAQTEIEQGTYIEPSKITVGEWLDIWMNTYLGGIKPLTVLSYTQHVNNHIKPALGDIKLDRLNPHTIQRFYNDLGITHDKKAGLSPKTVGNIHGVLHKALQQAVKIGYLRTNASEACELPRTEQAEIRPLDDKAIQAFMNAIQGHRFEAVYLVALFTGLRRGEVCGLTWDCVDLEHGTILVKKQLQPIPGKSGEFRLTSTKNSKGRKITAAAYVVDILRRQKVQQTEARLKAGPDWEDDGFVFTDDRGHHISPHTLYNNFKRIMASIGLPETRLHDLRHTYAVAALRAGDDIKTVQETLGHHSAAFTLNVYGHVTEEMKQASAARMDTFIKGISGA